MNMNTIAYLFLSTVSMLLKAFVISRLWTWFIASSMGAPPMSVPVAAGLAYLAFLLTADPTIPREKKLNADHLTYSIVASVVAFACGWIYALFL